MDTIKVTPGMKDIKIQLDKIKSDLLITNTGINDNLDIIKSNWKGMRSDSVLKNLEEIKNKNKKITDNLQINIDFIDKAYIKYMELEAARTAQAQATSTPLVTASPTSTPGATSTVAPVTPSPTNTPGVTPTVVPVTPSPTNTPGVTPTVIPVTPSPTNTPGATPTQVPVTPNPTSVPTEAPLTPAPIQNNNYGNKVTDMDSNGEYSRVINYQGANWNFFAITDPMWNNMSLYRGNKKGDLPMSRNGTHPFAAINALVNLGYLAGTKKEIVRDVASAFGTLTEYETVDGKNVKTTYKDGFKDYLGEDGIGSNMKFHTILKEINIPSTELGSNINNATSALENGKVVHCITQLDSNIAESGHYLVMVGVEKNSSGQVTGYYLLDGLARDQNEYNNLRKHGEAIQVIEPGLIRVANTSEALKEAKLASFRSIDGSNSQTQTIFSYEEYLNQKSRL